MHKSIVFCQTLCCLLVIGCQSNQPSSENNAPTAPKTSKPANYYTEPHRPQFHFSPEQKWMNDPNGMVFFEGEYHLFYQYYPDSTVWGPMHWGHALSTDLVHWEHLPIALAPDEKGYIFSGSAVVDWKNTSGFGGEKSGGKPPLLAMFTLHDTVGEKAKTAAFQSQGIAYSLDRGRTWTKFEANPVLPNPGNTPDFRDPKVLWHEASQQWIVVLAVKDHAEFWGSKDFKNWSKLSDFGKSQGTHAGVWECPDLFKMKIENSGAEKWVLLVNLNPGGPNGGSAAQYFVGDFDGKNFVLDPSFAPSVAGESAVFMDYGKDNYATVSWSDVPPAGTGGEAPRIVIGWMSNWQYAQVVPTRSWRSACTLPRTLHLVKTTAGFRLFSRPARELEKLRAKSVALPTGEIDGLKDLSEKAGFSPRLSELELEFVLPENSTGTFGIELSNSKNERYRIGYDAAKKQFFSDRTRAGDTSFSKDFAPKPSVAARISTSKTLKMHLFFDTASAELFADDGETAMTEIFFPSEDFSRMQLFSEGGKATLASGKAHELSTIWR